MTSISDPDTTQAVHCCSSCVRREGAAVQLPRQLHSITESCSVIQDPTVVTSARGLAPEVTPAMKNSTMLAMVMTDMS